MILTLWNFLRGYVIIEIMGAYVERFVNMAAHRGVFIWDALESNCDDGTRRIQMKVSVKAFKLLKGCAKKTGCKMRIVSKMGYPFFAHRYRKRKLLVFGSLFFLACLYFLSSFVWLIEVNGYDRITKEEILNFSSKYGLKLGAFKQNVDPNDLENQFLSAFTDISWINIYIKGTRATINLTEIIPKQNKIDKETPCNIVAKKNGLITKIATSAGTPAVKINDVVEAGDTLVKSEVLISEDELGRRVEYVHAVSEVWAKMYYDINFTLPYDYVEKEFTGKAKKSYGFIAFGKTLNLGNHDNKFANYDKTISRTQLSLTENYPLPFIFLSYTYKEFTPVDKRYTPLSARELADRMVTGRIIREFDFEADIVDKSIEFVEKENEIDVYARITTIERIDQETKLELQAPAENVNLEQNQIQQDQSTTQPNTNE